jgi:sucrose-phosphate synthase
VPLVFTGHSLGRIKRQRLLDADADPEVIERRYHFGQRIEAEERALENAALIVTSTSQEVREQYELYHHYAPERMEVLPPGVDLSRFRPPEEGEERPAIAAEIDRFLRLPERPMILAIARPDVRKNLASLVRAYARSRALRSGANLVILAGTRERIPDEASGARRVLLELLLLVDEYDLYGSVAYPKSHESGDVPDLYRHAARLGGVFVNPALTEPFGLTLIEAAASGLPIVATRHGGPVDIVEGCQNGLLVDPFDSSAIAEAIGQLIDDPDLWRRCSRSGIGGAHRLYSWDGHVARYLERLREVLREPHGDLGVVTRRPAPISRVDRMIVTDVDNTLIGDDEALERFAGELREAGDGVGFAVATGRSTRSAIALLEELDVPRPDVLITAVGTEIHYGAGPTEDRSWRSHIDFRWQPEELRAVLAEVPGLELQDEEEQGPFKISYGYDAEKAPPLSRIRRRLREEGLRFKLVLSHEMFLDVIPIRASPGQAIRFLGFKWNLPPERFLVAGDAGNDEEMLRGNTLGVVVGNYSPELAALRGFPRVYFAEGCHANGILEGIRHYAFFEEIRVPEEEE